MRDSAFAAIGATQDPLTGDSLAALFRSRYSRVLSAIDDSLIDHESFMMWLDEDTLRQSAIERMLRPVGCTLLPSEGIYSIDADAHDVLENAGPHLTPAMRRFLELRAAEEAEGFSNDASLCISWNAVSDRVATWEAFIADNPSFLLLPEASYWHDLYLRVYLTGMDNAPVFTYEDDTLDPEVRKSYQRFTGRYSSLASARLVSDYLSLLEREGFSHTEAVEGFLEARGIRSMQAIQPPMR
jgi:hypothetical protein